MSDKLPPKILVIEPDDTLRSAICNAIERYWFDVIRAKDADFGLRYAEVDPPHVIIISSRKQNKSASEIARKFANVQRLENIPMLFLIEEAEKEANYENITKALTTTLIRPFTPNELMTTIKSILRKYNPLLQDRVISYNDINMDLCTFKITRGDKRVHLGPMEFKILQLLVQNPKNVYSRDQIIDYAWGATKDIAHRTIDVHINRIRAALKRDSDRFQIIKTIRSSGYCLD